MSLLIINNDIQYIYWFITSMCVENYKFKLICLNNINILLIKK